jgi:hypothetical protein
MADNKQTSASSNKSGSELIDNTVYESSLVPVMWLVVPFVLVLAYGIFAR